MSKNSRFDAPPPATPISTEDSCGQCLYYKPKRYGNNVQPTLVCKRLPSSIGQAVQTPTGPGLMTVQPAMAPDDWCGEFKRRLS